LPSGLQRNQRKRYVVGALSHVPRWAVSASPTRAVPLMVGGSTLTGAASGAATAAATITSPASASGTKRRAKRSLAPFCLLVLHMVLSLPSRSVGRGSPVLQTQKRLFRGTYSIRTGAARDGPVARRLASVLEQWPLEAPFLWRPSEGRHVQGPAGRVGAECERETGGCPSPTRVMH